MNTEQQRINKLLDKAHDYSNSILLEMYETYGHDDQPYFLHVLLNQCALGLRYYGCDKEQIFGFIDDLFERNPQPNEAPDLSGYTIIQTTKIFTNTEVLKLKHNKTRKICYLARGHIEPNGWITKKQYSELLKKWSYD